MAACWWCLDYYCRYGGSTLDCELHGCTDQRESGFASTGVALAVWPSLIHTTAGSMTPLWLGMLFVVRLVPYVVLEEKWCVAQHQHLAHCPRNLHCFLQAQRVQCERLVLSSSDIVARGSHWRPPSLYCVPADTGHAQPYAQGAALLHVQRHQVLPWARGKQADLFCSAVLADLQPCLQIDPLGRCSSSTIIVWPVFMVLDIISDIVALVITKYFSAATSVAVSTLILPLQTILFQVLPRYLLLLWVCCSHGRLMLCCDAGAVHRWRVTTAWPVCVQYCRSVRRCAGCGRVSSCRGAFQQAR